MYNAVKGIVRGNTIVVDDESLEAYEGSEAIVTLLEKKNDMATVKKIRSFFENDKGWASEEEMLEDMAEFRRKRLNLYG